MFDELLDETAELDDDELLDELIDEIAELDDSWVELVPFDEEVKFDPADPPPPPHPTKVKTARKANPYNRERDTFMSFFLISYFISKNPEVIMVLCQNGRRLAAIYKGCLFKNINQEKNRG